ncbi:hypothetical protein NM208_g10119 [Fusarium decemcellulare]|uniref:Uncharacterized protein n=1 Tax=Fusarium decemcellulare TaxID=57161 RepID=A0ACC1RZ13_9HYPO|nr:hypothetical protein NM208_g10119 [Fusarium decemcellulare]
MDIDTATQGVIPFFATDQSDREERAPPQLSRQVVVLADMRAEGLREAFEEDSESWKRKGVRVIKYRHAASVGLETQQQMYRHIQAITRALRYGLELDRSPECLDMMIQYPPANAGATNIDTTEVGRVQVTMLTEIPSCRIRMDPTPLIGEVLLRRHYGDHIFNCFSTRCNWEIVEVVHPRTTEILNFPFAVCDPDSIQPQEDIVIERSESAWPPSETTYLRYQNQQRWFFLSHQKPFELLVRRVASSTGTFDAGRSSAVPMVVTNVTGDLQAIAENTVTLRFCVWSHRT